MKKVDSVFDESVISGDNTQEICNEHNVTKINYQKGRRMVLVNITNRTSTKSAFGDHIKSAVGGFLLGPKAFNSFMETLEKLSRHQLPTSLLSLNANIFNSFTDFIFVPSMWKVLIHYDQYLRFWE